MKYFRMIVISIGLVIAFLISNIAMAENFTIVKGQHEKSEQKNEEVLTNIVEHINSILDSSEDSGVDLLNYLEAQLSKMEEDLFALNIPEISSKGALKLASMQIQRAIALTRVVALSLRIRLEKRSDRPVISNP